MTKSATLNPLADFNDALNAIGVAQADIAADMMRRWLSARDRGHVSTTPYVEEPPYSQLGPHDPAAIRGDGTDNGGLAAANPPAKVEGEGEVLSPRRNAGSSASPSLDASGDGTDNGGVGEVAPPAGAEGEGVLAPYPGVTGTPSLEAFSQELREYQQAVLDDAGEFIEECWAKDGQQRIVYASPTGTGKGTMELALLKGLRDQGISAWILTPSLEVLRGFLERCGAGDLGETSEMRLAEMGESIFCTTPVRMRNRTLEGQREMPEIVIYDEVHHAISTNDVSGTLFAIAPAAVWIGFTATPYRASPKATAILREDWGEPVEVMSIPDAIAGGWQALPAFRMSPLVDDDVVKVVGGEFQVKATTKAYASRIDDLAELIMLELAGDVTPELMVHCEESEWVPGAPIPTCVTVPSSDVAGMLVEALDAKGVDSIWVNQGTKAKDRQRAYDLCAQGKIVLISIKVLNEGVDFPWLRRLIDARPTLSPVAWLQTLGRIMRPGPIPPQYICTNRNLERHAYLLQGALPRTVIIEAQEAFEAPSKRAGMRQIGLEALRRFKAIPIPLDDGATGAMYCLYSIDEAGVKTEYVTLSDPSHDKPFVAKRCIAAATGVDEKGRPVRPKSAYGRWALCEIPLAFEGYKTSPASGKLSVKMAQWWDREARKYGLSTREMDKLTRRQFQALPVLANTGMHLRGMSV